jgi:hypothetical protein
MPVSASPLRLLLLAATGTLLALCSLSARADFQSSITVKLIAPGGFSDDPAPTPINELQVVAPADFGTGITAAVGGPVGLWMLEKEEITFSGDTIRVRSYAGSTNSSGASITGYLGQPASGEHARFVFDGLSIAGKTIIGLSVTTFDGYAASGISGLENPSSAASLVQLIDADTVSLYLDDIVFADRGIDVGESEDHADFLITLLTQDSGSNPGGPGNHLPEPATLALFLVAAVGAGAVRRRA